MKKDYARLSMPELLAEGSKVAHSAIRSFEDLEKIRMAMKAKGGWSAQHEERFRAVAKNVERAREVVAQNTAVEMLAAVARRA